MPIYLDPIQPDDTTDDPETVEAALEENAKGPKSVFVDGERVEAHPLKDQIEADKYIKAKEVAALGGWPLKRFKISSPSAV